MTRPVRHILTGAAAGILCFCGAFAAEAQDIFLRPALESFIDKDTMLEFPAQVGAFQKVRVRKNEKSRVIGTVIRYENEVGTCADVYLYSLDEDARTVTREMFETHCRKTDRDIMAMPEKKQDPELNLPELKIRSVARVETFGHKAPANGFEAHYRIRNGSVLMDSVLYLALYRNKLVKIFVSYSPEDEDETASAYGFIDSVAEMMKEKSDDKNEAEKPAAGTDAPAKKNGAEQAPAAKPETGAGA
jgi:hypothetical protein